MATNNFMIVATFCIWLSAGKAGSHDPRACSCQIRSSSKLTGADDKELRLAIGSIARFSDKFAVLKASRLSCCAKARLDLCRISRQPLP